MRLMFICGSFEPGLDGVGDYVRRLAAVLLKTDYAVSVIAYHDPYVEAAINEKQAAEGSRITVQRIPSNMKAADKRELALYFIDKMNPDVISLQYVPYSFHKKGIPLLLEKDLLILKGNRRLHILFHELWLDTPSGLKQRIIGLIQCRMICNMIRKLKPEVVNVTVLFNQQRLRQVNFEAKVLDLFGNVYPDEEDLKEFVFEDNQNINPSILYFGEPPKGTFRDVFLKEVLRFCRTNRKGVRIVLACGNSAAKDQFCILLNKHLEGCQCEVLDCGFLSVGSLSKLMLKCQVGLSKSRPHLVAKSGAAMSMLEHGLPLWIPRWDGKVALAVGFRKQLIFSGLSEALKSEKLQYCSSIDEVAGKFIDQLTGKISLNLV